VFIYTNSAAVLTDALESIINLVAAAFMIYTLWLAQQPADHDHPYGHGKVEFLAIGLEGWLILSAGVVIVGEAIHRLIHPPTLDPAKFQHGSLMLAGIAVLAGGLAWHVWSVGKRLNSPTLIADGKHLMTDVVSTLGGIIGLLSVSITQLFWLDPVVAMVLGLLILATSTKLLWQSVQGLMDHNDPHDQAEIEAILKDEVAAGRIIGFHKVRHRHSGAFRWIDMHLQVEADMTVRDAHEVATAIEKRIEAHFGEAKATSHIEPHFDAVRAGREK
jgi:cation diffusion facilitator family transporter